MEVEVSKAPGVLGGVGRMRSSSNRFPEAAPLGGVVAGFDPERPRFRSAAFGKENCAALPALYSMKEVLPNDRNGLQVPGRDRLPDRPHRRHRRAHPPSL